MIKRIQQKKSSKYYKINKKKPFPYIEGFNYNEKGSKRFFFLLFIFNHIFPCTSQGTKAFYILKLFASFFSNKKIVVIIQ